MIGAQPEDLFPPPLPARGAEEPTAQIASRA